MHSLVVLFVLLGVVLAGCVTSAPPRLEGDYSGTFKNDLNPNDKKTNGVVTFKIANDRVTGEFTTMSGRRISFSGILDGTKLQLTADPASGCNVTGSFSESAIVQKDRSSSPGFSGTLKCSDFTASWSAGILISVKPPEGLPDKKLSPPPTLPTTPPPEPVKEALKYTGTVSIKGSYIYIDRSTVYTQTRQIIECKYEKKVTASITFDDSQTKGDTMGSITWSGTSTSTGTEMTYGGTLKNCYATGTEEGSRDKAVRIYARDGPKQDYVYVWISDVPKSVLDSARITGTPHFGYVSGSLINPAIDQFLKSEGEGGYEVKLPMGGGERSTGELIVGDRNKCSSVPDQDCSYYIYSVTLTMRPVR